MHSWMEYIQEAFPLFFLLAFSSPILGRIGWLLGFREDIHIHGHGLHPGIQFPLQKT